MAVAVRPNACCRRGVSRPNAYLPRPYVTAITQAPTAATTHHGGSPVVVLGAASLLNLGPTIGIAGGDWPSLCRPPFTPWVVLRSPAAYRPSHGHALRTRLPMAAAPRPRAAGGAGRRRPARR